MRCGRTVTDVFLGVDGGDTLCTNELMVFWCSLGELRTRETTCGCFCLGGVQTGVFRCSLGELRMGDVTLGCFCLGEVNPGVFCWSLGELRSGDFTCRCFSPGGVQTGEPGDMGAATAVESTNDLTASYWATNSNTL